MSLLLFQIALFSLRTVYSSYIFLSFSTILSKSSFVIKYYLISKYFQHEHGQDISVFSSAVSEASEAFALAFSVSITPINIFISAKGPSHTLDIFDQTL